MTDVAAGFAACTGGRYLSLESFRQSGAGVRTPVWFAAGPDAAGDPVLYVYTRADAGKAKRIRRSGAVRIAPCDARGKLTGGWVDARAEIVGPAEFDRGMQLLDRRYWPWKAVLDVCARWFSGHRRAIIAIRPV